MCCIRKIQGRKLKILLKIRASIKFFLILETTRTNFPPSHVPKAGFKVGIMDLIEGKCFNTSGMRFNSGPQPASGLQVPIRAPEPRKRFSRRHSLAPNPFTYGRIQLHAGIHGFHPISCSSEMLSGPIGSGSALLTLPRLKKPKQRCGGKTRWEWPKKQGAGFIFPFLPGQETPDLFDPGNEEFSFSSLQRQAGKTCKCQAGAAAGM